MPLLNNNNNINLPYAKNTFHGNEEVRMYNRLTAATQDQQQLQTILLAKVRTWVLTWITIIVIKKEANAIATRTL